MGVPPVGILSGGMRIALDPPMDTKPSILAPSSPPIRKNPVAEKQDSAVSSKKKIAIDVRLTTTEKAGAKKWFAVVEGTSFQAKPSPSAEAAIQQVEHELNENVASIYELPRSGSQHETLSAALAELRSLNIEE